MISKFYQRTWTGNLLCNTHKRRQHTHGHNDAYEVVSVAGIEGGQPQHGNDGDIKESHLERDQTEHTENHKCRDHA